MAIVEIGGLIKKFGNFTALNGVDLCVNQGEIYGFIGPNGAGKTTTLRIMLGILKATSGSVKIFGKDAWKDAVEIHKKTAYVPGEVNLWPNLTGGEVIDFFTRLRGSPNEKRKNELIERFQLDPSKKCRTYSKGNRQKVALIAAFASDAELYVLDEPTSGLDPLMENMFRRCVSRAKEEGKSVLLSSHILSEVEQLCDKVSIIRKGKIMESGPLEELRHLTSTRMTIETKRPVENPESVKGIHDIEIKGNTLSFLVDTEDLDGVLKQIVPYGIAKLESAPPTLEDLFMRHYKEDGDPS
jgi:ABC-2 type transport system ATP-binding protein